MFTIREAQIEDTPYMQYINQTCLTENYPLAFWIKQIIDNPKASFIAINEKGLIVGYILTCIDDQKQLNNTSNAKVLTEDKNAHIYSFAIFTSYRRLGLGAKLMTASINSCVQHHKVNNVTLNVRVSNVSAIGLYSKLGFEVVYKTEKYYNDEEDAYYMKLISSSPTQ